MAQHVNLTWSVAARATSYGIFRSNAQGVRGGLIGTTTTSTAYTDATVMPSTTYWYGVTARNVAGESPLSAQIEVIVPAASPPDPIPQTITSFTVVPNAIIAGATVTITWATAHASSVRLNGVVVANSGSTMETPSVTKSYTLVVSGAVPDISQVLSVDVSPVPPPPGQTITSFTALPSTITVGQTVMITWATTNATTVKLNNVVVAVSGSTTDTPSSNKSYTLLVSGSLPNISQTVGVTVNPAATPQQITSFSASPTTILTGGSSMLSWATSNATGVTLNGVAVGNSGTQVVFPTVNTLYTLVATGSVPPVSANSTVTVTAPSQDVVLSPPASGIVTTQGTWTLQPPNGLTLLNGVWVGNGSGSLLMGIGDSVWVLGGDTNWYQWYPVNQVYAWHIGLFGSEDPSLNVVAPVPAYVGPSNVADIWDLEMVDYQTTTDQAGYDLHIADYAFNPEYATDVYGIQYLRFTNNPAYIGSSILDAGCRLLAWFMPLAESSPGHGQVGATRSFVNTRYLIWIEDDVMPAFNENGMKMPGPGSDTGFGQPGGLISWRTLNWVPAANTYQFTDYLYDASTGSGFPTPHNFGVNLQTNRWYVVEQRVVLNTSGVANGYGAVWLNGNKVFESNTMLWRDDPLTELRSFFINVYHGGRYAPKGLMHYRIAKLAVSTSYIGVPSEFLTSPPSWRVPMSSVDTVYSIAGTAQMAGNMPTSDPVIYPVSNGKNSYDIITWSGFAADSTSWWGVAMGGHNGQWSNKTFRVNFMADLPQFLLEYLGTNETNYNSSTGTALIWSAIEMDTDPKKNYYKDGLPCSRHTYHGSHYIGARNRVMMFSDGSSFGAASHAFDGIDAYNVIAKQYDAAGTWPMAGMFVGPFPSSRVPTTAKHPTTEDVYMGNNGLFTKWTQSTGLVSTFTVAGGPGGFPPSWQFHGSLIDASRNRWVYFDGGAMQIINIVTGAYSAITVTGSATFAADAAGPYCTPVHDLDNDRYLLFVGNTNVSEPTPGRVYAVNPTTAVASLVSSITAPTNGWCNRVTYFETLGGVAFLPDYDTNIQFMPTRASM